MRPAGGLAAFPAPSPAAARYALSVAAANAANLLTLARLFCALPIVLPGPRRRVPPRGRWCSSWPRCPTPLDGYVAKRFNGVTPLGRGARPDRRQGADGQPVPDAGVRGPSAGLARAPGDRARPADRRAARWRCACSPGGSASSRCCSARPRPSCRSSSAGRCSRSCRSCPGSPPWLEPLLLYVTAALVVASAVAYVHAAGADLVAGPRRPLTAAVIVRSAETASARSRRAPCQLVLDLPHAGGRGAGRLPARTLATATRWMPSCAGPTGRRRPACWSARPAAARRHLAKIWAQRSGAVFLRGARAVGARASRCGAWATPRPAWSTMPTSWPRRRCCSTSRTGSLDRRGSLLLTAAPAGGRLGPAPARPALAPADRLAGADRRRPTTSCWRPCWSSSWPTGSSGSRPTSWRSWSAGSSARSRRPGRWCARWTGPPCGRAGR